uniref:penicillin acylase family protein n=1 Tax=Rhodothermus marinus TaxID=29549 RepID=UPI001FB362A1
MLTLKGLGPQRVRQLWQTLGITSLDDLEAALRDRRLNQLKGFGPRLREQLLHALSLRRRYRTLRLLAQILPEAEALRERLRRQPGVIRVELAGAVRRLMEVVDRVELVVAGSPEAVQQVLSQLQQQPGPHGETLLEGALPDGFPVRVAVTTPDAFGTVLWWHTGSEAHCRAFVRTYGAPEPCPEETSIYERVGLPFIPPELREDRGELEAAAHHALPALIAQKDLRGVLHNHSTYSDGRNSLREMAEAACNRGFRYFGTGDHSQSLTIAHGLSIAEVHRQQEEIRALNEQFAARGFRILSGTECDILPDGSLDYPDDVLAGFDYVVASVHARLDMDEKNGHRAHPAGSAQSVCHDPGPSDRPPAAATGGLSAGLVPHYRRLRHLSGRYRTERQPAPARHRLAARSRCHGRRRAHRDQPGRPRHRRTGPRALGRGRRPQRLAHVRRLPECPRSGRAARLAPTTPPIRSAMKRPLLLIATLVTGLLLLLGGYRYLIREVETPPAHRIIPGLQAAVTIEELPGHAVAIRAENLDDALAALGYVHGLRHGWPLLLWRQAALGRQTEWFGAAPVPLDSLIHALLVPEQARAAYEHLPQHARALLDSYARGLQTALKERAVRLRDELTLLQISVAPWLPWHSLAVERLLALLVLPDTLDAALPGLSALRAWLHLYGFRHSLAWVRPTPEGTRQLFMRYVYGDLALPFFQEVLITLPDDTLRLVTVPGTLSFPAGRTTHQAWYLLPRVQPPLLEVHPRSALALQSTYARFRLPDGDERLLRRE